MADENFQDATSLREAGNRCIKDKQYAEAAIIYTQAIKMEPDNEILRSNRSLAYVKQQQCALALEDAVETIRLKPLWPKGHFRKAEAEYALNRLDDALISYEKALDLLPDDPNIIEAILKVQDAIQKKNEYTEKLPWLCSCVGLILGVVLTILDYTLAEQRSLTNPLLQVVFVQVMAGSFWLVARVLLSKNNPLDISKNIDGNPTRLYILIGLILGGSIVIIDATSFRLLGLKDSTSRMLFTLLFAGIGFGVGSFLQYKKRDVSDTSERSTPEAEDPAEENQQTPEKSSNKYTKAQARYRYKKGKLQ